MKFDATEAALSAASAARLATKELAAANKRHARALATWRTMRGACPISNMEEAAARVVQEFKEREQVRVNASPF
jgi:hypothetical protein